MAKKTTEATRPPREKAFLIGVEIRNEPMLLRLDDSLEELALLSDTAGLDVVGEATQRLDTPAADLYIGSGKVEEVKAMVEELNGTVWGYLAMFLVPQLGYQLVEDLEEQLVQNLYPRCWGRYREPYFRKSPRQ